MQYTFLFYTIIQNIFKNYESEHYNYCRNLTAFGSVNKNTVFYPIKIKTNKLYRKRKKLKKILAFLI